MTIPGRDNEDRRIPDWALLATVFITGACVLVIELIGTRILAPYFGSGIYTWSALIAVTLAALALGYAFGGRLADRLPRADILYNLCLAAGLWTLSTPMLAGPLLPVMSQIADIRIGVLLSSLCLYFPNLFLLGAVGPFVIRLMTREREAVGSVSGRVFAVSTIGSLLGALCTGFVLIPNVGVLAIFAFCGSLLLALAILGNFRPKFIGFTFLLAIPVAVMLATGDRPAPDASVKLLAQTPSYYGNIQVIRKHSQKSLLVDGIGQNYVYDDGRFSTGYINFIAALPQIIPAETSTNRNALVIGLGAGQLPMRLQELGFHVEAVEIDPKIGDIARRHFGFDLPEEQLHYTDGRVFLLRAGRTYEYIVIDAFSAEQVAAHLVTLQAFTQASARLSDTGVLAINITSSIDGEDVAALDNTLKAVFPHVRSFSPGSEGELASIVMLASRSPIRLEIDRSPPGSPQTRDVTRFVTGELTGIHSDLLLTDDYNPVAFQRRQVQLMWRKLMIDYLGEDNLNWLSL
jgi:spermidine synthase